jgi:DNA-binding IclR family transcriptional regulator
VDTASSVVRRTAIILRAVSASEPEGARTSAVARTTGLPRPTAHRLLTSLLEMGFVDRDAGGRWRLGPELYLMGEAASSRYDVTELAQPFVRRLSNATGESAFFSARRGEEAVCLLREDGSFPIRSHVLYEGIRLPLGVASAGLVILAHLPDEEIKAYLARSGLEADYGDVHAPGPVWDRIRETRRSGYAVNPGLIVSGSWGLGAAVFDAQDQPAWALSLTGIEQRFGPSRRPELGRMLLRAAHELTRTLRVSRRPSLRR